MNYQRPTRQRSVSVAGSDYGEFVPMAANVLDPGPIPYVQIDLHGDPDLEHGLRHAGFDPATTTYRLLEIPLSSIADTASMPWWDVGRSYLDAMKAGQQLPPIVVMPSRLGWSLLDGVNRTHAHLLLGMSAIRAYELLIGVTVGEDDQ